MEKLKIVMIVAFGLSGCASQIAMLTGTINSGVAVVTSVNGAMPKACASAAAIAGDVGTAVNQVGAANPNNATVQSLVAKVNSGTALTAPDCASLQAALAKL